MKIKSLLFMLLASVLGGLVAVFAYTRLSDHQVQSSYVASPDGHFHLASLGPTNIHDVSYPDLTFAAEKAVNCVVHVTVKSMQTISGTGNPLFDYFFGPRQQQSVPREGFGSGVIISADGYIVTNNHVIRRSEEIEVTLNDKRVYTATLVGADPDTDIALLKIEETGLPFLIFGDSEALRVGEWVLAVGNPFNLYSTVTAGIVSAKSRGNMRKQNVEAFIQTDAAVNSGNSGGALVNIRGELVGINSMLFSSTGEFTGNAFAIPALIAQTVVAELKEFGHAQRALIGIGIKEIDGRFAKEQGIGLEGIYVAEATENGGAAAAGVKVGDVITAVNDIPVNSLANLHEQLAKYRPGDKVNVTVIRDKKTQHFTVTLRNIESTTEIMRGNVSNYNLGAKFEEVSEKDKQSLGIKFGVKVKEAGQGKLREQGVRNGFIITAVNDKPVNSENDINAIINAVEPNGRILLNGVYPNGQVTYYVFVKK